MLERRLFWALMGLVASPAFLACADSSRQSAPPGPVVVVGIDGASWSVIEQLWSTGRLPHLRQLAESGVTSRLTPVANPSPVIWTSMATGVLPERHGITNFVVNTEAGQVPVSSALRRVPAIWNMVSAAQRRVAVLGWWASWPAEEVSGIVVSDRAGADIDRAFHPPGFRSEFLSIVEEDAGGKR